MIKYIFAALMLWPTVSLADSALTFNGTVAQIAATPFPVHPSMVWVDIAGVSPQPKAGWVYNGGRSFTAPTVTPDPTDSEKFDRMANDITLRVLVKALAEMRGITPAEAKVWLKTKL